MKRKSLLSRLKTLLPHSLKSKLLARSLFILAALLLLIGALQYVLMKNFLYQNKAESMEAQLRSLPRDLLPWHSWRNSMGSDSGTDSTGQSAPKAPFLLFPDTSLGTVSAENKYTKLNEENSIGSPVLSSAEYNKIKGELPQRDKVKYRLVIDDQGDEQLVIFKPAGGPDSINGTLLQMGYKTAPLRDIAMQQLLIFLVLSLLAMAGGLALYLPVLRRTLVPLNRMIQAVEQTDAGSLAERVPDKLGQEEIERLAVSFNGMLERLEHSFESEREAKEQMRRFIADASHELRTPLTSIHGFLEVLLRGAADNRDQLYTALNSMHGESTRIKKLVEDLLLLAKLDRAPQLQLSRGRLDALILEMEPHLRMLAGERTVRFDLTAGLMGNYDPDQIKQVILNLFSNAIQHTDPKEGLIQLSLVTVDHEAFLTVRDNGPGISEDHAQHIFERFYRSDSSRTRRQGGAGLGLSISQSIVQAHKGRIGVDSKPGFGSAFWVRLPLQQEGS